jgi:hypothetical protein
MPDALATVRRFFNVAEAQIAQGVLEGAGIASVLQDENLSRLYGNVTGGVRLQVAPDDVSEATRVLDELATLPEEFVE